jgi:hypothetical protein
VILTVGAKAPGWPEFHFPNWVLPATNFHDLSQGSLFVQEDESFVKLVMEHVKNTPDIEAIQPENEPREPSGRFGQVIGQPLLKAEIRIIREIDGNKWPIEINVWSTPEDLAQVKEAFSMADIVGLDIYLAIPSRVGAWGRTVQVPEYAIHESEVTGEPVLPTETQAEPWGASLPNFDPVHELAGLVRQLQRLGYTSFEFWRMSHNLGRDALGDYRLDNVEAQISANLLGLPAPATLPLSPVTYLRLHVGPNQPPLANLGPEDANLQTSG